MPSSVTSSRRRWPPRRSKIPILTVIGLILSAVKAAVELSRWLEAHPEVGVEMKTALRVLATRLEESHEEVRALADPPEAP